MSPRLPLILLLGAWAGLAQAKPLVLLDAGHGGSDPGVKADGFVEAEFTQDLAKRVEAALRSRGLDVRSTHSAGEGLSLSARVELANNLQPLALVSLHANAAFQPLAAGPRIFVPGEGKVDEPAAPLWEQAARLRAKDSRALGTAIAKALGLGGPKPVQSLKMGLFRGLMVPVCVVETEFATRPDGLAKLKDPGARQALADRLAAGIAAYAGMGGGNAAP